MEQSVLNSDFLCGATLLSILAGSHMWLPSTWSVASLQWDVLQVWYIHAILKTEQNKGI